MTPSTTLVAKNHPSCLARKVNGKGWCSDIQENRRMSQVKTYVRNTTRMEVANTPAFDSGPNLRAAKMAIGAAMNGISSCQFANSTKSSLINAPITWEAKK